jgi:hypothetical protein
MNIAANTRVHIIWIRDGQCWYLNKVETARNPKGELYLKGYWNDDPSFSRAQTYEMSTIVRRRLQNENGLVTKIALQAGDTAELID